jgi:hypothetical protein
MVGQTAFFLCKSLPEKELLSHKPHTNTSLLTVAVGLQMGNTVISSYVVDCYPKQSMSIITFYSVMLDLSAFCNPVSGINPAFMLN